jgi:hypothetical protein
MGSLKTQLKNKSQFPQTYHMTDWEHSFVKELNTALATSIYHRRLMSGILTYIVKTRLGIEPDKNQVLKFQIDLDKDDQELIVDIESTKES